MGSEGREEAALSCFCRFFSRSPSWLPLWTVSFPSDKKRGAKARSIALLPVRFSTCLRAAEFQLRNSLRHTGNRRPVIDRAFSERLNGRRNKTLLHRSLQRDFIAMRFHRTFYKLSLTAWGETRSLLREEIAIRSRKLRVSCDHVRRERTRVPRDHPVYRSYDTGNTRHTRWLRKNDL